MALSLAQREISNSAHRFRVLIAGRRFGKSFLAMNEIAKVARYPNRNIYYVAPTYRQCKTIIWEVFKKKLQDINWIKKSNETDLTFTLRNNTKISLRGADNFDSLRGVGLDFIVMDEFANIEEKAWTEVLRPTLSDKQGSAMFIGTPCGTANWSYDLYNRGKDPNEKAWKSFQFTTLQGGNVLPEEIEQARRDLDVRTFRQEYEATFESYTNRLFYAFDREHNVKVWNKPTPATIYIGMDFNVDPMSMAVFAREKDDVYQIDEVEIYSSNTEEAVSELQTRYPGQRIWVYPDPACKQRKTSAGGKTDLTILQNAQFTVKVPNSHNPIRDGVNAVNSKLCSASGQRSYYIDPKCKKTIACLEKHSYKEGTSQPDKDTGYDHMSDAVRYYFDYVFPVRKDIDPELLKPQRFGHAIGAR